MKKTKKRRCPCCERETLSPKKIGAHEICSVCGWEDDPVQAKDPDFKGGANPQSLNQSRAKWKTKALGFF